jgi:hypothetical protein
MQNLNTHRNRSSIYFCKDITTGILKFESAKFISEEAHKSTSKRCNQNI